MYHQQRSIYLYIYLELKQDFLYLLLLTRSKFQAHVSKSGISYEVLLFFYPTSRVRSRQLFAGGTIQKCRPVKKILTSKRKPQITCRLCRKECLLNLTVQASNFVFTTHYKRTPFKSLQHQKRETYLLTHRFEPAEKFNYFHHAFVMVL